MKAVLHIVDEPELFDNVKNTERTPRTQELLASVILHRPSPTAPGEGSVWHSGKQKLGKGAEFQQSPTELAMNGSPEWF